MPCGVYVRTEETKRRMSEAHKGTHHSEKTKRKMSKNRRGELNSFYGKEHSKEAIQKMSKSQKGVYHSEKTKRKMSKAKMGNQYRLGTYPSEDTKRKISRLALERWQNPKNREKYLKAIFAGNDLNPTKPEKRLRNGLNKMFPGEYKYVGDGDVWIGGKCPDFININGQKKIIEMFGDYWHSKKKIGRTKEQEERLRINHFARYGYKTLIIWQRELKNIRQLKKKLLGFHIKGNKN